MLTKIHNCDYCKNSIPDDKYGRLCPYLCDGYSSFNPKSKGNERFLKIKR